MHQVTIDEAKARLMDLIDAAVRGEEILIKRDDRSAVKLVPVQRTKPRPQFGSAKGLFKMADDFDAPLEDFEEYMK